MGARFFSDQSADVEHERKAAVILDGVREFLALLNPEGSILEVNRAALEGAGHRIEEVRGKPFWTCQWWQISEETREDLKAAIQRAATGEFVRYEVQIYGERSGLGPVTIDVTLQPISGESGRIDYLLFEGRNIESCPPKYETPQLVRELRILNERLEQLDRALTEAELEKKRYQDLLEQTPAAIGLTRGPDHHWVYVNEQYVRVTGRVSAHDFIGKTVHESLPEIEGQGFLELLDEVYRTGQTCRRQEMKAVLDRTDSGQPNESYWDFVYQPVRDATGKIEGIFVHSVEVTDRVFARQTLEQSEERFRTIVQTTPECVKIVARDGCLLHMNSSGLSMIGAESAAAVIGKSAYDLVAAEDRERFREFNEKICRGEKGSLEFDIVGLKGVRRHMETHGAPLRDSNGETVDLAVTRDITKGRAAEEARRRLAAIVESSEDAIVSKDLNGIVTSWNPQAERMFGYTQEEMIGKPITTIIPPELHGDEQIILSKIKSGQRIEHHETIRVAKTGELIDVSLSISPVKDEQGKVVGAAKIARDIREHKRIEHAMRTTEKLAAAGRVAATVAHEINNPLQAATNLVYLAETELPDADKVAAHLNSAKRELDRVAHIARQTLGFFRENESPASMNIADTVEELLLLYEKRLEARSIAVVKQLDRNAKITAYAGKIRQALSNLLTNSMDAMSVGGTLMVRVRGTCLWNHSDEPGVRITIADTGSGISPEARRNLFQAFFTTKADVGTGLGLWITRGIVDKHAGIMNVKSRIGIEKHGTVISMLLPSERKQGTEISPTSASTNVAASNEVLMQ